MKQWWFDDGLGLNQFLSGFFLRFSLIFKVFNNIHEYVNLIIRISGNWVKDICITFNLVSSL